MICDLCPRRCGAERTETAGHGYCRMPAAPILARADLPLAGDLYEILPQLEEMLGLRSE